MQWCHCLADSVSHGGSRAQRSCWWHTHHWGPSVVSTEAPGYLHTVPPALHTTHRPPASTCSSSAPQPWGLSPCCHCQQNPRPFSETGSAPEPLCVACSRRDSQSCCSQHRGGGGGRVPDHAGPGPELLTPRGRSRHTSGEAPQGWGFPYLAAGLGCASRTAGSRPALRRHGAGSQPGR